MGHPGNFVSHFPHREKYDTKWFYIHSCHPNMKAQTMLINKYLNNALCSMTNLGCYILGLENLGKSCAV